MTSTAFRQDEVCAAPPPQQLKAAAPGTLARERRTVPRPRRSDGQRGPDGKDLQPSLADTALQAPRSTTPAPPPQCDHTCLRRILAGTRKATRTPLPTSETRERFRCTSRLRPPSATPYNTHGPADQPLQAITPPGNRSPHRRSLAHNQSPQGAEHAPRSPRPSQGRTLDSSKAPVGRQPPLQTAVQQTKRVKHLATVGPETVPEGPARV